MESLGWRVTCGRRTVWRVTCGRRRSCCSHRKISKETKKENQGEMFPTEIYEAQTEQEDPHQLHSPETVGDIRELFLSFHHKPMLSHQFLFEVLNPSTLGEPLLWGGHGLHTTSRLNHFKMGISFKHKGQE